MKFMLTAGIACLLAGILLLWNAASLAQESSGAQDRPGSPLHPTFPLRDEDGANVLETGNPVSAMMTCGACHDTQFIAAHSDHVNIGMESYGTAGQRAWDNGRGWFGAWNPILYRYLSPEGDSRIDLTTAEWVQLYGVRHVGGGPASLSREGAPLDSLPEDAAIVESSILDPLTGEPLAWDWEQSGTTEMNCFLCHLQAPNNDARIVALQQGAFAWASTATLQDTGIVGVTDEGWHYNVEAFDEEGRLLPEYVTVQDPTNANCGQCHGTVHDDAQVPLQLSAYDPGQWSTYTSGQVFSPQRMSNSGVNLQNKNHLSRSWDVHAERAVTCTDCHYSLNNPVFYVESDDTRPEHLEFDPRRMDFGEYLERPLHQFANASSSSLDRFEPSSRSCVGCHDPSSGHEWLPYVQRHINAVACETCHIPTLYAPTLETVDWTVIHPDSSPRTSYRGVGEDDLLVGYQPVLLPQEQPDGSVLIAPYNLVTAWYWVYGAEARPVPLRDLQAAWLDGDAYHEDVLAALDADGDGTLAESELLLDSDAKIAVIAARLEALGLENPRIVGDVQPYAVHHNVTNGEWAIRDCDTCHAEDSLMTAPMLLSGDHPGGASPTFYAADGAVFTGEVMQDDTGLLFYVPQHGGEPTNLYVLGLDSVGWVDWVGTLAFLGVWAGVILHGGLRVVMGRRQAGRIEDPQVREVYMYTVYEREWHWMQTILILGLIFTGLVIHRPQMFRLFNFDFVVYVHNAMALLLILNAALALFYHVASGEIRQYLPQPRGFFSQMVQQARYYLYGIFRGEPHPFEKMPERKLNPLQQLTYLAILNVLLPLQIITGILMWGAQQWPDLTAQLGGLPFLAPFHTLIAWFFATFIVMHVYLTTTGHTPLANIRAMMFGWDEVEEHEHSDGGDSPAHIAGD